MTEVGTSVVPRELLREIVQFLRIPECDRLVATSLHLASYILPHGARIRDATALKVCIVYVKLPDKQQQNEIASKIKAAFCTQGFFEGDQQWNPAKDVRLHGRDWERDQRKRALLGSDEQKKLVYEFLAGGEHYVTAIPFRGQAVRIRSRDIVMHVVVGANEGRATPLRILFSTDGGWFINDYTQGSGVVMVVDNAGQHPFVSVSGDFHL